MRLFGWIADLYRLLRGGPCVYVPERDPDVRALRYQRRQSERALRHFERRIRTGNIVETDVFYGGEDDA